MSGDSNVSSMINDYYSKLFTTSEPSNIERSCAVYKEGCQDKMNKNLIGNFSKDEVMLALKQMASLKAPGPNGMPPIFFQHYCESMGDDVATTVLSCLNLGKLAPSLNHTFISLISKVKSPELVSQFRLIALCNILYKPMSKVLANKLKKVLPHIISESQSTFQSNRAISDNILVAFKTLHHMKMNKTGKVEHMALKLDMSKSL